MDSLDLLCADYISIGFESPAGQTYASAADLGKLMTLIFSNDKPLNPQEGQVCTIHVPPPPPQNIT